MKPRGIATASKTRASALAVCFFEELKTDEHGVIAAVLDFVLHYNLPPLDVPLVAQIVFVVRVASPTEQRDLLRLLVHRYVGVLDVPHRCGLLPLAQQS